MCRSALVLLALVGCTPSDPAPSEPGAPARLRAHVETLASDAYGGRGTGEEGERKAATYAAERFAEWGLTPRPGDTDYFADYTLYALDWDPAATALALGDQSLAVGRDFRPFPFSDEGEASAPVVFAGYGITAPEYTWDDYDGLDVAGKWVLVLRHEPREDDEQWSSFDGSRTTDHASFQTKARVAAERGAVGMLLITDPLHHTDEGDDFRLGQALRLDAPEVEGADPSGSGTPFLALHVSREAAASLLAPSGRTLAELQTALDAGTPARDLALEGITARASVKAQGAASEVPTRNVVAVVPGTDSARASEWIVVGAHYDHLGSFHAAEGDATYNGADDNASGSAGLLELARRIAAEPLARPVAFALFSGEEKGLLGSRALVRDRQLPVDDAVFMLNLDMIGRNPDEPMAIIGEAWGTGVREAIDGANASVGLELAYAGDAYTGNSDHDPFYREGVPFVHFFTGLHDDYHQLSDHPELLAYDRMAQVVDLSEGVLRAVGRGDWTPRFVHHLDWLGAKLEVQGDGAEARAVLSGVDPDGRAAAAGLTEGAVLASLDGAPIDALTAGEVLAAVEPGTTLALGVAGIEAPVTVERAKTGYLGVFPRPADDELRQKHGLGEGEGVLLARVVPDGPASTSGLQEGDVIVRIGGMPVGVDTLGQRLARIGAGERVPVEVLRGDERLTLSLVLGERPER